MGLCRLAAKQMLLSRQSLSPELPIRRGSPVAASFPDTQDSALRGLPVWAGAERPVWSVEAGGGADQTSGRGPSPSRQGCRGRTPPSRVPSRRIPWAVPTGSQAEGGQSGPDKGAPRCRALVGLSVLLIHDSTFHLPEAREGPERPISQLTKLKGHRAVGGAGRGWGQPP